MGNRNCLDHPWIRITEVPPFLYFSPSKETLNDVVQILVRYQRPSSGELSVFKTGNN
jgi:hypothetical protein